MKPRGTRVQTAPWPNEWNGYRIVSKRTEGEEYNCERSPGPKKGAQACFADFENEAIACSARWHISQPGRPGGSLAACQPS